MEIGPIVARLGASPPAAVAPSAVAAPVRTDLPRQAAGEPRPPAAQPDQLRDPLPDVAPARERQLSIDPVTRSLVSLVFDGETGELLSQVPDVAILRMRAYAREALAELEGRAGGAQVVRIV